jgi:FixJ family two-component response regulator
MTGYGDIQMSVRAMKGGAVDFLTKPFRDQDMLDAIDIAVELHRTRRTDPTRSVTLKARYDRLSARERQVMKLACAGRLNKQIAAELGIQEVTVKMHRAAAMRKMQSRSLAELARMAQTLGLFDGSD